MRRGNIGFGQAEFTGFRTTVSFQSGPLLILDVDVHGIGENLIDGSLLSARELFQLR